MIGLASLVPIFESKPIPPHAAVYDVIGEPLSAGEPRKVIVTLEFIHVAVGANGRTGVPGVTRRVADGALVPHALVVRRVHEYVAPFMRPRMTIGVEPPI